MTGRSFGMMARATLAACLGLAILAIGGDALGQSLPTTDGYKIRFVNNSGETGDFCVFQKDPDIGVDKVMSLAWYTKRLANNTSTDFSWTIDYSFVFSQQGRVIPGVPFITTQSVKASPQSANSIEFDKNDGAYSLSSQAKLYPAAKGSLVINQGPEVVKNTANVGIGMAGFGSFVVPAEPNQQLTFTPHPKYYVAFGNYKQGQVLDIQSMIGTPEVEFRGNIRSVTVTLNADNTWTMSQD